MQTARQRFHPTNVHCLILSCAHTYLKSCSDFSASICFRSSSLFPLSALTCSLIHTCLSAVASLCFPSISCRSCSSSSCSRACSLVRHAKSRCVVASNIKMQRGGSTKHQKGYTQKHRVAILKIQIQINIIVLQTSFSSLQFGISAFSDILVFVAQLLVSGIDCLM